MMKYLIIALLCLSNAYAFEKITLKKDVVLKYQQRTGLMTAEITQGRGNDYCILSLSSKDNTNARLIKKGTSFEVQNIIQNHCARDWGRQCRLDLEAINIAEGVDLDLMCKDRGLFASELTPVKVEKILKEEISVQ